MCECRWLAALVCVFPIPAFMLLSCRGKLAQPASRSLAQPASCGCSLLVRLAAQPVGSARLGSLLVCSLANSVCLVRLLLGGAEIQVQVQVWAEARRSVCVCPKRTQTCGHLQPVANWLPLARSLAVARRSRRRRGPRRDTGENNGAPQAAAGCLWPLRASRLTHSRALLLWPSRRRRRRVFSFHATHLLSCGRMFVPRPPPPSARPAAAAVRSRRALCWRRR